jgi:tetratricopeptide (TPR) repeat protein
MPQPIDLDLERLKRLPQTDDVWQLALLPMPKWVAEKGRAPYRPLVPLCRSTLLPRLGTGDLLVPGEPIARQAFDAIACLAKLRDVQYRPSRVEVRDLALVESLRQELAGLGIELALVERLDFIDEVAADMAKDLADGEGMPGLYAGPDLDVERLRAFAQAASDFHRAAPWNQLTDEDLLRVDSPVPDEGLRFLTVLGAGGIERGIGFYRSERDFQQVLDVETVARFMARTRLWLFSFDTLPELSIPDGELWEAHGLPLAQADAYPALVCHVPRGPREPADAARLTFAEGLLRALAATTEDELDSGRWSKTVATCDGERTVELSIPGLLEPAVKPSAPQPGEPRGLADRRLMEKLMADVHRVIDERGLTDIGEINEFLAASHGKVAPHEPDTSPEGRAQAMFYQALDATGRLRIKLAREAIALHPDCADAWVLLAEEMPDPSRRIELYARAVSAAERTLGRRPFAEEVGHFWGLLETRPYMRARLGQAECLWGAERYDEALGHLQDLLRLNPGDNQGVRHLLVPRLIELERDKDAARVLESYPDDPSAVLEYARALLEFRHGGDGATAQAKLAAAIRCNPHVVKYLSGSSRLPAWLPEQYGFGTEDEAVIAAASLLGCWNVTAGAAAWLRDSRLRGKKARERKRRKGPGKKR